MLFILTGGDNIVCTFSYPGCCVLHYPPVTYKCNNPTAICAAFVDCLHSRLPALCGYPLNYSTRLLQPDVGLTTALQSQTFVNLLHVGRKPSGIGVACNGADSGSPVLTSNHVVKPSCPYIPIFHSSSVSGKVSGGRGPLAKHPQTYSNADNKLLTTANASSDVSVEQDSIEQDSVGNNGHTKSTSAPNKRTASNGLYKVHGNKLMLTSCMMIVQGISDDNGIHNGNYLITQVSTNQSHNSSVKLL